MKTKPVKPAKPALPKARVMYHGFDRGFTAAYPRRGRSPRLSSCAVIPGTAQQSRALVRFFNMSEGEQVAFLARFTKGHWHARCLLAALTSAFTETKENKL